MTKSGWKTSEFWVQNILAPIVGAIAAAFLVPGASVTERLAIFLGTLATSLGYTGARSYVKVGEAKASALIEASKANPTAGT